jgi:hypothetical protein
VKPTRVTSADANTLMGDNWALLLYSPDDSTEKAWLVSRRKAYKENGRQNVKDGSEEGHQTGIQYDFFVLDEHLQIKPVKDYYWWIVVGKCYSQR